MSLASLGGLDLAGVLADRMTEISAADRIPSALDALQNTVVHLEVGGAGMGLGRRRHGEEADDGETQQGDSAGHVRTSFLFSAIQR
jgi:hypothetical protein